MAGYQQIVGRRESCGRTTQYLPITQAIQAAQLNLLDFKGKMRQCTVSQPQRATETYCQDQALLE
jgi:hypothetical protein